MNPNPLLHAALAYARHGLRVFPVFEVDAEGRCACGKDCTCKGLKADDPTKCTCGKDVVKVSLKGLYACSDGECIAVSDKAGKCRCGKDLVEVK